MTEQDLQRFSQAVLVLQECDSPARLGDAMLQALVCLCPADAHAINSIGTQDLGMYAASVDYTAWQMEVFNAHLAEHPLFSIIAKARAGGTGVGRWSDHTTLRQFRQKALYHDFFRHTDTQHQIASTLPVTDGITLGLSLNRSRKDFRAEDVKLLELLLPHVACTVRRILGQTEVARALALRNLALGSDAVCVVDEQGSPLYATESALQLFRDNYPDAAEGKLPEEILSWLRRNPAPDEKRVWEQPGRRLTCAAGTLVPWPIPLADELLDRIRPAAVRCLRLTEQRTADALAALGQLGLTPREAEVLRWMAEGKRNSEIAIILGVSERTVDKHRENLFAKLGAETRTGAVALAWDAFTASSAQKARKPESQPRRSPPSN